jgi:hypothetical protein
MNGCAIIGHLLRGMAELTAMIPAANIKAGELEEGQLGILVRTVTLIDRHSLSHEALQHSVERVSATVRAKTYRDQVAAITLIRRACAGVVAAQIGEATNVAVLTAGTGPDVRGPGNTFEQAQDFRVSFNAPA